MTGPPIMVDTDGGLDDVVALRAVAASGRLHGVSTTWGNVSAMAAARNARIAVGPVPVWCGSRRPPRTWRPEYAHGFDGLGGTTTIAQRAGAPRCQGDEMPGCHSQHDRRDQPHDRRGAVAAICDFARDTPGGVLLCIGPLTNLAAALGREPDALRRLATIVVLAGVGADRRPLMRRVVDTNTRHDPAAAATICRSDLPICWVGVDVSGTFRVRATDLPATAPQWGYPAFRRYGLRRRRLGHTGWSSPCHDLVAAAAALEPGSLPRQPGHAELRCWGGPVQVGAELRESGRHEIAVGVDLATPTRLLASAMT